ncbi:hypothetical protein NDU88_003334 [Pleurodeles waltl]|uniref:Uncharacterized protein n=1 Tax=Pleurodeles waltl TaxID=8319 RepID=A0AAV7KXU9_PLEWA|nr:hypothetical protein NDU88_003334 [Pleurodeles waltl]
MSETARGGEDRVDTGGPNQQSTAKQHSPSVVAQMVSLSHAASLVQERAPCCPQSPLVLGVEPRSSSWLRHQLQHLPSGDSGNREASSEVGGPVTTTPLRVRAPCYLAAPLRLRFRLAVKWSEHRHRLWQQLQASSVSAAARQIRGTAYQDDATSLSRVSNHGRSITGNSRQIRDLRFIK